METSHFDEKLSNLIGHYGSAVEKKRILLFSGSSRRMHVKARPLRNRRQTTPAAVRRNRQIPFECKHNSPI